MAMRAESQFFESKPWLMLCTGGLLTTGGLGWCLRLACAKDSKLAVATYLAGSAGVCLTNASFHYRPVKTSSVRNWIMLLSGEILSATGYTYLLTFAMEENQKSATLAYIVGTLGYTLSATAVYRAIMFRNGRKNQESQFRKNEVSADEIFHIPKCGNPTIRLVNGMYQCENCKVYFGGKDAENKPELTVAVDKRGDFLQKMQKCLKEINSKREKNLAAEKICNGDDSFGKVHPNRNVVKKYNRADVEKCRDGTTQTDSGLRMTGTQTQESHLGKLLGRKPQLQINGKYLPNGYQLPEKH